jgi:anion-transporting  ArsA/GET3 family ATPase
MRSLLNHKLLFVTGKGGVGKTTVAAALGQLASERGLRTIVCEVGDQQRLPALFARPTPPPGDEQELAHGLWGVSVSPRRTLLAWLGRQLGSGAVARALLARDTFQYIVAASPGSAEVVTMTAMWELVQPARWDRRARTYDLAIVDAPSSGHALGMLRTPATYHDAVPAGPIARQAQLIRALFEDPRRTALVAVAHGAELPVTETLEMDGRLRSQLGRGFASVIVNATFPRRFSSADLEALARAGDDRPALRAGRNAAIAAHRRWSEQNNQVTRLRRHMDAPVLTLPFVFAPELDRDAVTELARVLGRRM